RTARGRRDRAAQGQRASLPGASLWGLRWLVRVSSRLSCNPQVIAGLLVTSLQVERNDQILVQTQRQRWERLANSQDMRPGLQQRSFPPPDPTARCGVEVGRSSPQRRVAMPDQGQQLGIKVEVANGYQIDDADRHPLLHQGRAF